MNTHDKYELPPLPKYTLLRGLHTSENMQKYARTAIEPYQQRIAELESQLEAIGAGGVSSQRITSPSRGEAVAFAKDGNLFWRGDPVAWREFSGELYLAPQPADPSGASTLHNAGSGAQNGIQATQPAEPVKSTCKKCNGTGVESTRFHGVWPNGEECLEPIKCDQCDGFGTASADEPVKVPGNDERAAQGLPPYNPRKPTEEELSRLTENGRKAWGKKPAEPEKEPPCET